MNPMHAQHPFHGVEETPATTTLAPAHQRGDLDHTDEAATMNPRHAQHHDGMEETPATARPGPDKENQLPNNTIVLGDLDQTDEATSADFDGWINLPPEMCRLILDRLDAFDILRFPLGRGPWAVAYVKKRRLQPGAPTLLTSPSDDCWEIPDGYERGFFFIHDILSRETFSVEVEGLRYVRWVGGKDGWLVATIRESCIRLLNPITGHCTTLPDYFPVSSDDRVQLCRTPSEAEGYFAIAISFCKLSYTMDGCDHWITLENPNANAYWLSYSDAILHRSNIIAICRNSDLWSWDLDQGGKNPKLLVSSSINTEGWSQFDFSLATSLKKDNILIVSLYGEDIPIRMGHRGPRHSNHWNFLVDGTLLHELDVDAQRIEEVRDIGDHALFLGPNYPIYVHVSMPFGDLKKNYLYIAAMSDHDAVAIDLSVDHLPGNASLIDYSGSRNPYQKQMWFIPVFP